MGEASSHSYVISIGSNMRVPGVGNPRAVIARAVAAMTDLGISLLAVSSTIETKAVGPSLRRYANAAALVETGLGPAELLWVLQRVEEAFGRRRRGQRWRARPLDLDIVFWSGGIWLSPELAIPHPRATGRRFVIEPAAQVAPSWREPLTGLTLRQLAFRGA